MASMQAVGSATKPLSETPHAEYRPHFVLWTSFVAQIPLQLFFAVWSGGFVGGLLRSFAPALGISPVGIGVLVFFGFPAVSLSLKALNYASTVYSLHGDRLVIEEGYLTQHHKEIPLAAVREISLRRGILQRLVGLGSVYVATQATGTGPAWTSFSALGASSTFGSGAMLRDLADANDAYALLTALRRPAPAMTD
jgi:membrane protein YdbS with pleckstrin-like domain